MEISAFRPTRTLTAELPEAPAPRSNPLSSRARHDPLRARPISPLRIGLAVSAVLMLQFAATVGWLALGAAPEAWPALLLRAAALALLGYAIALCAGIAAARQRHLQLLAATAVDRERRKISLDLHDGALQPYLGLKLGLEALRRKVEPGNALTRDIDELYRMTQESIAELRGYVRVLGGRPRRRAGDLASALRRQIGRFEAFYGLKVDLTLSCADAPGEWLAEEIAQMVAESLSNIGRHTAARRVAVALATAERELVLRIVDDGGGREAAWRSFTPVSLTLRANRLGGRVEVAPHADGGTEVRIAIPL